MSLDAEEFMQGQRDCKDGIPHRKGTDSYIRGYAAQCAMEQVRDYYHERDALKQPYKR